MTTGPLSQRRTSWVDDERALESSRGPIVPAELVLEQGTRLAGKYRLDRPAGFGGMAQLWVATNASTGAEVCVKVLVPDANSDESVKRFRREAHAAARLGHRAIVRVFDLVELDANGEAAQKGSSVAALAIVMELLSGETLGDALMKRGKIPLEETLDIMIPVLSALAHAHRAGVVHRDVKPDNVFLAKDPDGHVIPKVLDFGISKLQGDKSQLTNDGVMLGTPNFMSPEQARGASKVDARTDVFSAAIMMVMMLSGQNPFDDESFHSVVSAILVREVQRVPRRRTPSGRSSRGRSRRTRRRVTPTRPSSGSRCARRPGVRSSPRAASGCARSTTPSSPCRRSRRGARRTSPLSSQSPRTRSSRIRTTRPSAFPRGARCSRSSPPSSPRWSPSRRSSRSARSGTPRRAW